MFRCVCVCVCKRFQREYLHPAKGIFVLKVHRVCIRFFNRLLILAALSAFALKCVHILWICQDTRVCVCWREWKWIWRRSMQWLPGLINNLQRDPSQTPMKTHSLNREIWEQQITGWRLHSHSHSRSGHPQRNPSANHTHIYALATLASLKNGWTDLDTPWIA